MSDAVDGAARAPTLPLHESLFQQQAAAEEAALDAVELVVTAGGSALYNQYLLNREVPYAAASVLSSVYSVVRWQFLARDKVVLPSDAQSSSWQCEDEPVPAPIDSWARGAIPTRPKKQLSGDHGGLGGGGLGKPVKGGPSDAGGGTTARSSRMGKSQAGGGASPSGKRAKGPAQGAIDERCVAGRTRPRGAPELGTGGVVLPLRRGEGESAFCCCVSRFLHLTYTPPRPTSPVVSLLAPPEGDSSGTSGGKKESQKGGAGSAAASADSTAVFNRVDSKPPGSAASVNSSAAATAAARTNLLKDMEDREESEKRRKEQQLQQSEQARERLDRIAKEMRGREFTFNSRGEPLVIQVRQRRVPRHRRLCIRRPNKCCSPQSLSRLFACSL